MAYKASRRNDPTDNSTQNNSEMVSRAADVAQHSANPYAKAAGTAIKVGDKLTKGKVSDKMGQMLGNSPAERLMALKNRQNTDSRFSEMLQKNGLRKNRNNQNTESEGEQKSSPSSDSKKEDKNKEENKKDSNSNSGEDNKRGLVPSILDNKKKSFMADFKMKVLKAKLIFISIVVISGFLLLLFMIIAISSTVLSVVTGYDDAIGMSTYSGKSTGNTSFSGTEEQNEFYKRVSDVELDYLSKGQQIDSLKVVAVYHVLKENGANVSYTSMSDSDIREIADSMLNAGIYDEETFKSNLVNSIFPKYFPNSSKETHQKMANSVFSYTNGYYQFINEEEPIATMTYSNCSNTGTCSYDIKGYYIKGKGNITENIQVSNLYVRLMQCGTANGHNYGGTFGKPLQGEQLVPFEKYILGVAYQEIGPSAPAEAVKAQMVAARSYILARHADMGGWRTLKKENGQWVLQAAACTQDQVYCDPDKGCSATNGQWGQVYSGQGHGTGLSRGSLAQSSPLRTYANQTSGEVLVNNKGNIIYSGYTSTEQKKMNSLASQGLSYKQILLQIYNQGSRNYGATDVKKMACTSGSAVNCGTSSGAFTGWKQAGASWSNVRMGNSGRTIGQIGCLVTSISMLIAKSGVQTNIANFNPGTFVQFLNKNGGFDSSGNLQYAPISKAAPNFRWVNQIDLRGMSRSQKLNTIAKYQSQGYYMTAEVSTNGQHWVAIDSVNGNTINILDPATNITNLWGSGKYTPQSTKTLNIFKVG